MSDKQYTPEEILSAFDQATAEGERNLFQAIPAEGMNAKQKAFVDGFYASSKHLRSGLIRRLNL